MSVFFKKKLETKQIKFLLFVAIIAILLLVSYFHFFSQKENLKESVVTALVNSRDFPVNLSGLGSVTPVSNVSIQSQISGYLIRVLFDEGAMVKAGDLLAVIDPRPYQAQVAQFSGQLDRDEALLANAKLDLKRYQTLWLQDAISKQTLDTQVALVKQYEGSVILDQGQLKNAEIMLGYCYIRAPVSGRIGLRGVDPGNLVQANSTTPLAVINVLNPTTVIFSLPEDDIPQVNKQLKLGKKLLVRAYNRDKESVLAKGILYAMDSQIDSSTGTVKFRAAFNNASDNLFPNQFVNIVLQVDVLKNTSVIPAAALQYGQNGPYVFLVNEKEKKVSLQPVAVRATQEDEVAITNLAPGQRVVIDGADKLREGTLVSWQ